jgi:N-dimethylarginine dimethylaminohydrolase
LCQQNDAEKPKAMLQINVKNETSRLRAVVLGSAVNNGPTPSVEEAYDPKSLEHILAGTYPVEKDMINEMEAFNKVFEKYDVKVFRPEMIENYNQIFARDIGFVIDDTFIKANILPDRERELDAIQYVIDQIDAKKVVRPPEEVHIEGGDVMVWNDYIFIGTYKGSDLQGLHHGKNQYARCGVHQEFVSKQDCKGIRFGEI